MTVLLDSKPQDFDVVFKKLKPYGRYNFIIFLCLQLMAFGGAASWLGHYTSIGGIKPEYICHDDHLQNETDTCTIVRNCSNLTIIREFYGMYEEFEWACIDMAIPWAFKSLGTIPTLVGIIFSGQLTDRLGRKSIFVVLIVYGIFNGFATAAVPSWPLYMILGIPNALVWGLASAAGYPLTLEPVGKKYRLLQSFAWQWTLAYIVGACVAYLCHSWRVLVFTATLMTIPAVAVCIIVIQESPRWLIQRHRYEDAAKALNRIAFWNGQNDVHFTPEELMKIQVEINPKSGVLDALKMLRNKKMFLYTLTMVLIGFAISAVCGVVFMNIGDMAGSPFINAALFGVLRLWSPIVIVAERKYKSFGRRVQLLGSMFLVLVCFLAITLIYALGYREKLHSLTTGLSLFGFAVTVSVTQIAETNILNELYPTNLRATSNSAISFVSRLLGMVVPQFVYLRNYWSALPYLSSAVVLAIALVVGFVILPETKDRELPDTIAAAVDDRDNEDGSDLEHKAEMI